MKYVAFNMAGGEEDVDLFDSEDEAWYHILENHICPSCGAMLSPEGELQPDGSIERCEHPSETPCGAEWEVMTEYQWEDLNEPGGDTPGSFV